MSEWQPIETAKKPTEVRGVIKWQGDDAYLGRLYVGTIDALLTKPLQYSVRSQVLGYRSLGYFPTPDLARAALEEAVREAVAAP